MNVGIIGFGSMGKMLAEKFSASGLLDRESLLLSSRSSEKLKEAKKWATICKSNTELAVSSDIVFLCLRPFDLKGVLEEIRDSLKEDALLVSLNGSVSFKNLEKSLSDASYEAEEASGKNPAPHKIAKVIPSVTAEVDRSQTLICYNDHVTSSDKGNLKRFPSLSSNMG